MNAQQLRNSILQEAISGRLVPQDPNDEPASVLLDKIRKEKQQLVKEGRLKKKDLVETPISEDEKPFDIPESWEWVKVSSLFLHGAGKQLNASDKEGSLHEYITTSNLYWDRFELSDLKSMYYKDSELEKCTATKGDLLVCEGGDVGRSAIWPYDYDICLQNHVHKLRPLLEGYTRYVYYAFWYYKSTGLIGGKGIGIKGFSATVLKNTVIPLPPLAEQKRIVEKIEELMPKVEEYGKAQEALDKLNNDLPERLKKSILQEAISGHLVPQDPNDEPASVLLGRIRKEKQKLVKEGSLKKKDLVETPISEDEIPFEIPESWEWVRVKDIFIINPKVIAEDNADAAFIPMEKIEARYGSAFTFDIRKWKDIKSSFTCFADGDVAFAKITPCFQNRKSMILKDLPNGIGAGTTELQVLRLYGETICREYLLYFLASSYFIDEASFKGTANQQRIIVGYLENKPFPLPPLAEQKRIVEKIEQLFKEIDKLKK